MKKDKNITDKIETKLTSLNNKFNILLVFSSILTITLIILFLFTMLFIIPSISSEHGDNNSNVDEILQMQQVYREHNYLEVGELDLTKMELSLEDGNDNDVFGRIGVDSYYRFVDVKEIIGFYNGDWVGIYLNDNFDYKLKKLPNYAKLVTNNKYLEEENSLEQIITIHGDDIVDCECRHTKNDCECVVESN